LATLSLDVGLYPAFTLQWYFILDGALLRRDG
jgi:hypothetical protein